jgi:quercetin dioxygenase-like cupin family protein
METWDLSSIDVQHREPEVLVSTAEGRAIAIRLPAGEALDEHQVHERAWLIVIDGKVELSEPGGETVEAGPGLLAQFKPAERHKVRAIEDARVLLILSPWPGEGHPSQRGG